MKWSKEKIWEWYNSRPYDPKEIELIKEFCRLADENFSNGNEQ